MQISIINISIIMESNYLENRPEKRILFYISPPFAKHYGVLPVDLSEDKTTLHVVSNKNLEQKTLIALQGDTRKKIVVDEIISQDRFDKAYNLFYQEFLPF
jgi:hypothetical protein